MWIYLVPFSFKDQFWEETIFWIGLFFVTFPLNFLVYGLNDYNDVGADAVNERKGNFLFGARSNQDQLKGILFKITIVIFPFFLFFVWNSGWEMFILLLFMIGVNVAYNFRPFRLKERPPYEILIQIGYVVTGVFSVLLNELPMLPWQTLVYLSLFAFQAHIAGEIMDIEPDLVAGKKTTATLIGRRNTKFIMLVILLIEIYILVFWFNDWFLAGFLGVFSAWLILDVFFIFKDRPYSLKQMKLFGVAMNVTAIFSMLWVLYSGNLMNPNF